MDYEELQKKMRFPTMLRKMWSGKEVQDWIDVRIAELSYTPSSYPVPHGWKLVPIEPTQKMIDAGYDTLEPDYGEDDEDVGVTRSYKAMLSAAPQGGDTDGGA